MGYLSVFIFMFLRNFMHLCEAESDLLIPHRRLETAKLRSLLSVIKHSNHSHNGTREIKFINNKVKDDYSVIGTEVAVLFIVVVVVLSVIGMLIYFLRKFDQLNKSLPTYRYSSLKTEINGYGPDDKNESQALVTVSTEEEDDYDVEEEDLDVSPPTLLVRSQTVMPANGVAVPVVQDSRTISSSSLTKSGESSIDSDDELLQ